MLGHRIVIGMLAAVALAVTAATSAAQEADLILARGRVWTGDSVRPWAEAVAVRGERVLAVGAARAVLAHRTSRTRVIDLGGAFVAPGFIDSHTHFDQAGALILGVSLLDVAGEAGLIRRVREARDRLPAGAWVVGGEWGAYEAWAMGSTGRDSTRAAAPFVPHRAMLDSLTPRTPLLLSKWDRSLHLANAVAIERAGLRCGEPGVDCEDGRPTGRLTGAAVGRVRAVIPPKPMAQRLAESRAALAQLREAGVTTIHDITNDEQLRTFEELRRLGQLTVRVYARPTLDHVHDLAAVGIRHGFGDAWIRIGGLKGFVDGIMGNSGARFYEPYLTSGERGIWRTMMDPPGNMERLILAADSTGHWPQVHAIGDQAVDTLLDLFERAMRVNGDRERRFRLIHAQVLRGPEVAQRMARLGVIAEVQPYHTVDDMRWMEQRIGARSRWAYAFRTLETAGVRLCFGSDWPGTNASLYPTSPVLGIYAAVTRQTLDGRPEGGWFPEERVSVETALRAYTVNNAWAAGEEDLKGRLAPGLLADVVVLDRDPFGVRPGELKDLRVLLTMVGGVVVHDARGR